MPAATLSLLPDRAGLPRGRAALSEAEVGAAHRARIMQAVTDEVAEVGYARTTVAGITARARISRTTFYQWFAGKEESFAAAHEAISEQLVQVIRERAATTPDSAWQDRIALGVQALAHSLEARPTFARSYLVEVHGAGERLGQQRDRVVDRHARSLARVAGLAAAAGASVRIPTQWEVVGAIGATEELFARQIRRTPPRRRLRLAGLVDPVVTIHTAVLRPL
ncbi:TetR/AcrR family transcriptional regulator [Aeromicrobium senzhongii]|uniref:TetR/AcrR family transcriptional regulator n=1 Tax=Aeromicrobium senzhongii TaxID=2663859 RepID=A0ABX6SQF5_9ACTN|nr:TetR/AcrR family transcriptional regulator [Aeromicrobium senzhongii]MTB89123.1 TetR family transcriptional regulator [Aeromicrobium senzhongii]QNL93608.1 TetR/AcrR family transcriptional regulator [Aeromicrobium senzhongii]